MQFADGRLHIICPIHYFFPSDFAQAVLYGRFQEDRSPTPIDGKIRRERHSPTRDSRKATTSMSFLIRSRTVPPGHCDLANRPFRIAKKARSAKTGGTWQPASAKLSAKTGPDAFSKCRLNETTYISIPVRWGADPSTDARLSPQRDDLHINSCRTLRPTSPPTASISNAARSSMTLPAQHEDPSLFPKA
jgi:hypothetical protein